MSCMRVAPDGSVHGQTVLGIVHATCSQWTFSQIYDCFFSEVAKKNPWGCEPLVSKAAFCRACNRPLRPDDQVALVPICA